MAWHSKIRRLLTNDTNHADTFNYVYQQLFDNTEVNRESIETINTTLDNNNDRLETIDGTLTEKATKAALEDYKEEQATTITGLEATITEQGNNLNTALEDYKEEQAEVVEDLNNKLKVDGDSQQNLDFITSPKVVPNISSGIKVDLNTDTITRIGTGSTLDDFYNIEPWASMKREIIEEQHMVKIPLFYYKRTPIQLEDIPQSEDNNEIGKQLMVWTDEVSAYPRSDFFVHPAFIRGGKVVPYIYFSAFEGSIYDVSEDKYLLKDEQVADFDNDLLCSIPNAKPCSGLTQNLIIENARKLAENRTAISDYVWHQQDFSTVSAIQLLVVIATGSYDCQTTIGRGVADLASGTGNESATTGQTLSMGSRCGYLGENGKSSVNAFGIENFYSNMWKFVDGINIECRGLHQAWISNDDYTCNTSTGKDNAGFTLSKVNGYMSKMGYNADIDWLFLPSETLNRDIISKDYFYQNNAYSGFLIARLGGCWDTGSRAGCFCWTLSSSSASVGARSFCIPKKFL